MDGYTMLTLSDPEFHTRIMHKYRSGKRKYIVFPALVYNQLPRWLITFHNKLHVTVQLRQMFQGFAYKPIPKASAFKDKRDHVKRLVSFPKDIFQWILVANKEARKIYVSNSIGMPSKKAIHSPLAAPRNLNSVLFLRKVTNKNILNEGTRSRAEDIKENSVHNTHKLIPYFESRHKMLLPLYISNFNINDIGHSEWKKTLFTPSVSLVDVNRNIQVHPVHKHELRVSDSMNVLRINEAKSPGASNEDIGSLNIKARNISQVDTELVFHALPDIDHLINQKLMEIKSSIALTKETMMAQSATIYSKIETDLKRQFNINQISEQVYRQIDHRLKIECERRGLL